MKNLKLNQQKFAGAEVLSRAQFKINNVFKLSGMKTIFLSLLLTSLTIKSNGQLIKYHFDGAVIGVSEPYFAYIVRTDEIFEKKEIVNGKFSFRGEIEVGESLFKSVFLIVTNDGNITFLELESKYKNRLWKPEEDYQTTRLVLEDISFTIKDINNIKKIDINSGGKLTSQMEKQSEAMRNREMEKFVLENADSPISLNALSNIVKYYKLPENIALQKFGDINVMFNSLSDRLKQSSIGKKLKQKIDEL